MPRPPAERQVAYGPYKHRRQFRIVIRTPGNGGRRETNYRSFETEERAKAWKREFNRQSRAGSRTVADAAAEYLDYLRTKRGNKESSITTSRYRLSRYLDFDMPLVDLNNRTAIELYEEMLDEGYERGMQKGKRYAPDSHHASVMEAKAFASWCMRRSYLSANPFEDIELEGKKRRRKKQLRVDEARKFVAHCMTEWRQHKDRSAIAALLPLQFNLRASEVANLIARDVDDRGRLLWVAYNEDDAGADQAKTETSKRTVSVPPQLVPVLREIAEQPAHPETGRLFAKENGEPADRHWVRYWAIEHAKEAGTPPITTHGLRGTWSSLKRADGYDDEQIAKEMGHADRGETAARHYIDPQVAHEAQTRQVADTIYEGVPMPVDEEQTPRIER